MTVVYFLCLVMPPGADIKPPLSSLYLFGLELLETSTRLSLLLETQALNETNAIQYVFMIKL